MKLALALLVVSLAASGCGESGCERPEGTYRIRLTMRSGDCGAVQDQVGPVDFVSPLASLGCSGQRSLSADQCEVSATNMKCPAGGTSGRISGTLRFNADASLGTGTVDLSVVDGNGAVLCSGAYGAAYTKL